MKIKNLLAGCAVLLMGAAVAGCCGVYAPV